MDVAEPGRHPAPPVDDLVRGCGIGVARIRCGTGVARTGRPVARDDRGDPAVVDDDVDGRLVGGDGGRS